MTDHATDIDVPETLDLDNLDQYSEEQIEAYNEQREREFAESIQETEAAKSDAVDALRKDARDSLETETVTLGSGVELEVRARIPPAVEQLVDVLQRVETGQDAAIPQCVIDAYDGKDRADFRMVLSRADVARHINAVLLVEMVESPADYQDPSVWVVASRDGDAGIQWLQEATESVLGPAKQSIEEMREGNSTPDSGDSQSRTKDKQSGWQRQR